MKIKSLLIAALAMVAFASCNKKDVVVAPEAGADKTVTIRIHSGVTRAFEAPVAKDTETEINEAIVYFLSGTTVLHKVEVKDTEIDDLKVAAGKKFENVPGSVDKVMVLANNNAQVGAMTAGTQKAIEELAFTTAKENVGPGVAGITLLGAGDVVPGTPNKAEVTVSPIVARVEVSGEIITTDGMKDLKVLGVYMDNYHTTYGDADTKKDMNKDDLKLEDLTEANYPLQNLITADVDRAEFVAKKKVAAYHVFQKEAPIVVVKISYILNGNLVPEQYITLTKLQLKDATEDKYAPLTGVKGGFIYQIDLAKVDWNGNGKFDKPQGVDPNKPINNDPDAGDDYNPVDPKKPEPDGPDAFDPTMAGPKPHAAKKDISVFAISNPWKTVEILPAL